MSNFVTKYAASSQEFEQGFFQLAYDKLQSKLFNLLPFMVGFELVKRSPDDTRAIGVFGFKSGNGQILYVPAFFINGKVKDMEIMYSKNNNQFYPLNEDFAALFLKDDVTGIGAPSRESKEEIQRSSRQSNLTDVIRPPRTGKISYAEAKADVEFNAEMHKTASTNWLLFKEAKQPSSLTSFLTEAPTNVKTAFVSLLEKDAEYASAVRSFYTDDELVAALAVKAAAATPLPEPELQLLRLDEDTDLHKQAAKTKAKLLDKGFCLVDKRPEEKKSVVGLFTYTEKFGNPAEPGCYYYVTQLGDLCKGLVLTKPRALMTGFSLEKSFVVNLETEKLGHAYVVKNSEIFVKDNIVVKDLGELLKGLPEAAEGEPGYDDYVLINERLVISQPFRIIENFKDANQIRKLKVRCTYGWNDKACCNSGGPESERETFLVLTKQNNDKLEHRNGIVYVPRGFKLLKIDTNTSCYPKYDFDDSDEVRTKKRKAAEELETKLQASKPGGLHCLEMLLATKNVFPLTLQSNGSEYFLNIHGAKAKYASADETLISLVAEAGLSEADAQMLLDSVKLKHKTAGTIKLAYLGDQYLSLQEEQPSMDEFGTPTYYGVPHVETASTEDGYQGDPTQMGLGVKPDQDTVNQNVNSATSLAQGGQKEIFDTQSIATLSRYTDPSSKILSYVPDFITSLDKLGRMLFMSYWQTEEFEEMYGKDELPELVELVKNVFNNLGDLIIFLKRKVPDLSINTNEQAADQI
ncbi:MAG: hypothetical protein EBU46_00910 [Nitrosomonadaceae bacterium]|nr:hypothetical protein [Nitrosomonadaceae bacterium]